MKKLKFIKDDNKLWFIDLPNWIGSHSALQMVAGADTLLDLLSNNGKEVTIEVKKKPFEGYTDRLQRIRFNDLGADYIHNDSLNVWLCAVTIFVFGYFPSNIYFKKL
jgi:hypothetical protein